VNVTAYNSLKLTASGTGNMQITLVKKSIDAWEDQYKTEIALTNTSQEFVIPFNDFIAQNGVSLDPNDVVTMVFTMTSETGELVAKTMDIKDVSFAQSETLSTQVFSANDFRALRAVPNPMESYTMIYFNAPQPEMIEFSLYNPLGKVIYQTNFKAQAGKNQLQIQKQDLLSGLYFCKITNSKHNYKILKLVVK